MRGQGAANAEFGLEQVASRSMSGMNGELRSIQPEVAGELVRIGAEGYEWRRQAGLTQRALEALTGLDQTTISKFERGKLPGLRLHHVATIRLACRTAKRVDSSYGRRQPTRAQPTRAQPTRAQPTRAQPTRPQPTRAQPTRPMMTPESSEVGGGADLRTDADDGLS
jgi:transcriptional regulator with XRE-family HTH domain